MLSDKYKIDENSGVTREEVEEFLAMGGELPEYDPNLDAIQKITPVADTTAANLAKDTVRQTRCLKAPEKERYSFIKDFPTAIVRIAQAEFPNAKTQTDALVAYIFCNCPDVDMSNEAILAITDAQKDLIYGYEKSAFSEFNSRLQALAKKSDNISNDIFMLRTLITYLLYDYLNIGNPDHRYIPGNGRNFDITDKGRLLDFLDDMMLANKKLKEQIDQSKGSPTLW